MAKLLQNLYNIKTIFPKLKESQEIGGRMVRLIHTSKKKRIYNDLLWDTLIFNNMIHNKNIGIQVPEKYGSPISPKVYQSVLFKDITNRLKRRSDSKIPTQRHKKEKEQAEETKAYYNMINSHKKKKKNSTKDEKLISNKPCHRKNNESPQYVAKEENNGYCNSLYSFIKKRRNLILNKNLRKNNTVLVKKKENQSEIKKDTSHKKLEHFQKGHIYNNNVSSKMKRGADPSKKEAKFTKKRNVICKKQNPCRNQCSINSNSSLYKRVDPSTYLMGIKSDPSTTSERKKEPLAKKVDLSKQKNSIKKNLYSYRYNDKSSKSNENIQKMQDHFKNILEEFFYELVDPKKIRDKNIGLNQKKDFPFKMKANPPKKKINLLEKQEYPCKKKKILHKMTVPLKNKIGVKENDSRSFNSFEKLNGENDSGLSCNQKKKYTKKKTDSTNRTQYSYTNKNVSKKITAPSEKKKEVKEKVRKSFDSFALLNKKKYSDISANQKKVYHFKEKIDPIKKIEYPYKNTKEIFDKITPPSEKKKDVKEKVSKSVYSFDVLNRKKDSGISAKEKYHSKEKIDPTKKIEYPYKNTKEIFDKKTAPSEKKIDVKGKVRTFFYSFDVLNRKKVSGISGNQETEYHSKEEIHPTKKIVYPYKNTREIFDNVTAPSEKKIEVKEKSCEPLDSFEVSNKKKYSDISANQEKEYHSKEKIYQIKKIVDPYKNTKENFDKTTAPSEKKIEVKEKSCKSFEILNRKKDSGISANQEKEYSKEKIDPTKKTVHQHENTEEIFGETTAPLEKKTDAENLQLFDPFDEILKKKVASVSCSRRKKNSSDRKVNPWKKKIKHSKKRRYPLKGKGISYKLKHRSRKKMNETVCKLFERLGVLNRATNSRMSCDKKNEDFYKKRKWILVRRMKILSKRKINIIKRFRAHEKRTGILARRSMMFAKDKKTMTNAI